MRDIHLSTMSMVLNILYLIFNVLFYFHQTFKNIDLCMIKFMLHVLLNTWQQTCFSTDFFLYVLTNRRFREEFYTIIKKLLRYKQQQYSSNRSLWRRRVKDLEF